MKERYQVTNCCLLLLIIYTLILLQLRNHWFNHRFNHQLSLSEPSHWHSAAVCWCRQHSTTFSSGAHL